MRKSLISSVLFAAGLFFLSLLIQRGFAIMGVTEKSLQQYVVTHYWKFILIYNLKILLIYLLVGFFVGIISGLFDFQQIKSILLFNCFFWGFFWIRAVKLYPQMFVEQLYSRGTVLKLTQILITDYVPLEAIYGFALLLLFYLSFKKKKILPGLLTLAFVSLIFLKPPVIPSRVNWQPEKPNLLILASDSLRPFNISFNGYYRKTPNIDRLFSEGVNFLRMKTSLARTFPSWTSILTSLYPFQHGIRHMFPDFDERQKRWLTLVDVLRKEGYFTGVVSDFAGDMFSRIDFGFDYVKAPYFTMKTLIKQRSLEIQYPLLGLVLSFPGRKIFPVLWEFAFNPDPYFISYEAKRFIKQTLSKRKPFFLIAFYSCTHFPYAPPYPYYQLYTKKSYRGLHKYKKESLLEEYTAKLPAQDVEQIRALYDGGVKLFDDTVGDMLRFLEKSGLLKNTIVVIMSDHGENLYENSYGMGHGDHLRGPYASTMTFGIWSPFEKFGGKRIWEITRDIDIAPTLLELLGIPVPLQFKGKSLLGAIRGKERLNLIAYEETGLWYSRKMPSLKGGVRISYPEVTELLEVETQTHEIVLKKKYRCLVINSKHRSLSTNQFKYIYMPGLNRVKEELYQLAPQAPEEKRLRRRRIIRVFASEMKRLLGSKGFTLDSGYIIEKHCHPPGLLFDIPVR